ncbi:toxin-antitoxin system YwqK family antitoxin, partial [bacterium]|nr:toxin-antitoxin system YwqK family antitoxin [bacterium]
SSSKYLLENSVCFDEDGLVLRKSSFDPQLNGDISLYARAAEIGEALFRLTSDQSSALNQADVKKLQAAFAPAGQTLIDDAVFVTGPSENEWTITQPDMVYTVLKTEDGLDVYPGRLRKRSIFAEDALVSIARYLNGRLEGRMIVMDSFGEALFQLEKNLQSELPEVTTSSLLPVFADRQYPLSENTTVEALVQKQEWLILDLPRTYTLKAAEDEYLVYPGRVTQISNYRGGLLDGQTLLFDDKGMLAQQIPYKSGQLDGVLFSFLKGQKVTSTSYASGKPNGPMFSFDEEGHKKMAANYVEGQLGGKLVIYKKGSIQTVMTYSKGKEDGPSATFHPNGTQIALSHYANGELNGEQVLHFETGGLFKKSLFEHDKLEGPAFEYHPNGRLRKTANYKNDKLHGEVCEYDKKGKLKKKQFFRDGKPIGEVTKKSRFNLK